MADQTLSALAATLSSARLAGWRGLPVHLHPGPLDDAPALVTLGSDFVPAELVHLHDPAEGAWARAWLRDGFVALLEVAWRRPLEVGHLGVLGEPVERTDAVDGIAPLPDGEWLYPDHGLAAVVDTSSGRIRRLLGFVPTSAQTYRRELRPDVTAVRRSIDHGGGT